MIYNDNITFLANLKLTDLPFDRIKSCIPALKYLAETSGLNFKKNNTEDFVEVEVVQEYSIKNYLTDEYENKENLLFKIFIDYKTKTILLEKNELVQLSGY